MRCFLISCRCYEWLAATPDIYSAVVMRQILKKFASPMYEKIASFGCMLMFMAIYSMENLGVPMLLLYNTKTTFLLVSLFFSRLEMPDGVTLYVKVKPSQTVRACLEPILARQGISFDHVTIHLVSMPNCSQYPCF